MQIASPLPKGLWFVKTVILDEIPTKGVIVCATGPTDSWESVLSSSWEAGSFWFLIDCNTYNLFLKLPSIFLDLRISSVP